MPEKLSFASKYLTFIFLLIGLTPSGCLMPPEEASDEDLDVYSQEVTYNGHDYLFVTTPKTWYQAQTYCANYGAPYGGYHLVTINDAGEEAFLDANESNRSKTNWWIGYSDQGVEGSWIWSNGYSTYTNWYPGEPNNNGDQDCAVDRYYASQWDDQACGVSNVFICERDALAVGNKGSFTYSASFTYDATYNTSTYAVYLYAGQLFTAGTCGLPGASGNGDTWLRLKNPSGVEVASNNSSSACGWLSNFSIVAETTGTYVIHAGCFDTSSCSGTVAFNY